MSLQLRDRELQQFFCFCFCFALFLLIILEMRSSAALKCTPCVHTCSYVIHNTHSAQISQKQDERNLYAIMKTMCPSGCHHNGFVATHALGHMMYGYTLLVPINQRVLNKLSKEHNIK